MGNYDKSIESDPIGPENGAMKKRVDVRPDHETVDGRMDVILQDLTPEVCFGVSYATVSRAEERE